MAAVFEEASGTLAQQHLVLGDHNPHENSAVMVVPRPSPLALQGSGRGEERLDALRAELRRLADS
ncbi:MAG TPA: hypothetical protein VGV86_03615 [Acidimicrobiales bacterium]|nr:hypothetical protein [Acidimicrobiales bacterium]